MRIIKIAQIQYLYKNKYFNHMEGSIQYLGFKEDVRPYIEKTSIYVLPSYLEGTPRTV